MTEPKRWTEDGASPEIERLLSAAKSEEPTRESLARTLTGLGVGVGVAGAATSAGASSGALAAASGKASLLAGSAGILKWMLVVSAIGAIGVFAQVIDGPRPTPKPTAASGRRPGPSSPVVAAVDPVPSVPESESAPPSMPAPSVTLRRARPQAPTSAATKSQDSSEASLPIDAERLAEEVASVDRARRALSASRASEALVVLDDYEAGFAKRRFEPEALYLRMQALLALGRMSEARGVAERLVTSYPKSPHTERARLVLSRTNP